MTPAALAVALRAAPGIKAMVGRYGRPNDVWWEREAAAILAVMPVDAGWASVLERQLARDQAEIDRLRKLLAFSLSVLRSGERLTPEEDGEIEDAAKVRAYLEEVPV